MTGVDAWIGRERDDRDDRRDEPMVACDWCGSPLTDGTGERRGRQYGHSFCAAAQDAALARVRLP